MWEIMQMIQFFLSYFKHNVNILPGFRKRKLLWGYSKDKLNFKEQK